jgi:hypothetical protein
MAKKVILLGLTLLLALAPLGCSDDDDDDPAATGVLDVYVTDAPANLTEVNITFSSLKISTTGGAEVDLAPDGSTVVDLIAASTDPAYLGSFNIPPGVYNCMSGAIEVVNFTTETGNTCTLSGVSEVTIPQSGARICAPVGIVVDENSSVEVLLDLPLTQGDCPSNGGEGTLVFDPFQIGLMP